MFVFFKKEGQSLFSFLADPLEGMGPILVFLL